MSNGKHGKAPAQTHSDNEKPETKHAWKVVFFRALLGIGAFLLATGLNFFGSQPKVLYLAGIGICCFIMYGTHRLVESYERRAAPPGRIADSDAVTGHLEAPDASGSPDSQVVFSTSATKEGARLEIGDSGAILNWRGPGGQPMFRFGDSGITVERLNNHFAITTGVRDANGKLVAEIVRNEWKVRPSLMWDRNFNENALEVRDEGGDVILQVVALPDRIQLQGKWHDTDGRFFMLLKSPDKRRPEGLVVTDPKSNLRITPMFRYPSERNLGQKAE